MNFSNQFNRRKEEVNRHGECGICFDALSNRPVGMLMCVNSRQQLEKSCTHIYHRDCLSGLLKPWFCPQCRKSFSSVADVPALKVGDPAAADMWFSYLDSDNDGSLSYDEILDGLKAQIPLEWPQIECDVDAKWGRWDKNGDGTISKEEFFRPTDGFLAYLTSHYPQVPHPPPPDIKINKEAWFRYWDHDNSGQLSKDEVARALVKTFKLYQTNVPPSVILESLDVIWSVFDTNGSNEIDIIEFCSRDNLGDSIIAQLAFAN